MIQCIRIGFGKIARIHEEHLKKLGVQTIGVVEINPKLRQEIEKAGLIAFKSIEETIDYDPDFYDVCIPANKRLEVIKSLCSIKPEANILIEKPVCSYKDAHHIRNIFKDHRGRVVINENYASSNVTSAVLEAITSRELKPRRLIIESTKHRGLDFLQGRFLDAELGALGYEGSHLLAIIGEFGDGYEIDKLIESDIDNIHLSINKSTQRINQENENQYPKMIKSISHQGGAFIRYRAINGCIVDLYTSMAGIIGFPCPPIASPGEKIPHDDLDTRYRILRVDAEDKEGVTHQIVGFFEPILGLERSQAQLFIFKNWILNSESGIFDDNSMSQHLFRAIRHFCGHGLNPYGFERALKDVMKLYEWSQTCWHNKDDSDEYLGSKDTAEDRFKDAEQFWVENYGNTPSP